MKAGIKQACLTGIFLAVSCLLPAQKLPVSPYGLPLYKQRFVLPGKFNKSSRKTDGIPFGYSRNYTGPALCFP